MKAVMRAFYLCAAVTGGLLWYLSRNMDADPGTFVRLLMLALVLSLVCIALGLVVTFLRVRKRAKMVSDALEGKPVTLDHEDKLMQ